MSLPPNVITAEAVWELRDALDLIDADENIRAVIVIGRDGFEPYWTQFAPDALQLVLADDPARQPSQLLARLRVPSVAALFGRVAGPALELALACDLRIAADDASLAFDDVRQGRLPSWGGTQRLSRIAGIGRALELVLLGEPVPSSDALSYGIVSRIVPRSDLAQAVSRIVEGWVAGPPIALSYLKEAVSQGADLPLDRALRLEWDLAVLLETTRDRAEGIAAFLAKRPPRFSGE